MTFNSNHQTNISGQMECGAFDDHALRATFGLEFQIFRCSKILLTVAGAHEYGRASQWRYKVDIAPLYDSIRRIDNGEPIPYGGAASGIDGQTAYWDWYKNLGTRSYYLGDVPLIDSYIERQSGNRHHIVRIGRQRNFLGINERDTPYQDDGKFAPYQDWLVRDLYAGLRYGYHGRILQADAAVFSGNNPLKGDWYLRGAAGPNLKTNNTGIYALAIGIAPQITQRTRIDFALGAESNILGSTWDNELGDGKRNNHRTLGRLVVSRDFAENRRFTFLAQATRYISGLREESAQSTNPDNSRPERFRNITQEGYFAGFHYQGSRFDCGYIYESFDRFDAKIFARDDFNTTREGLKQKSNLYYAGIKLTPHVALKLAWHNISNHAPEVSEIPRTYNAQPIDFESRFKLVTQVAF